MVGTVLQFKDYVNADSLAENIGMSYNTWSSLRRDKVEEWKELRNYIYATSTKTTSNSILPWSNSTTTPKLTQIYDNLHANYMASLFPQSQWLRWIAGTKEGNKPEKQRAITSYMHDKIANSGFKQTVELLVQDYIQFGNCFAMVTYENDYSVKEDNLYVEQYSGPMAHRISPYDIVFNPVASCFTKTPKIIRSYVSLGEIKRKVMKGEQEWESALDRMLYARAAVKGGSDFGDTAEGYIADGFNSISSYYEADYAEVLTFHGDLYDTVTQELKTDRTITIVDRAYVVSDVENPSWFGHSPIYMAGWRTRPDNLYAMGPLDNLVGLQYRIDHLENLKADVFDQIAYPILKIRGDVEDFDYAPGERIFMGEEGDVSSLVPDATALNADFQIQTLEAKMEELAGAPRQAMGIRTPGEKTAFEVQTLDNASGRIFQSKTAHFEESFLEPILNSMLEESARNMNTEEVIRVVDTDKQAVAFQSIERSDIVGSGRIKAVGARHFAERARRVQNLTNLLQAKQDPGVAPHISGKKIAQLLSEEIGEPDLYGENIAVTEQLETTSAQQDAEAVNAESLLNKSDFGV